MSARARTEAAPPSRGGRVAVGIDPSRAALQIAVLAPEDDRHRQRRVPLAPAGVGELAAALEGRPAVIAMEGSHSTGQLFLLELLAKGYDVREVHPAASKRFREALTEDHTDAKDAAGLALLARWKADLPAVRFSAVQATWKGLARLRGRLVVDRTRDANRLHACLSETYGAAAAGLFPKLLSQKALRFFAAYPTLNDALDGGAAVREQVGEPAWGRLVRAGRWGEGPYLDGLRAEVRVLAAQVLALKERVAEVERAMARVPAAGEVARLLTMPQVGVTTALTIAGDTGDPARFGGDADRYVAYCGLAPALHQSGAGGPSGKPRRRYNRRLKRAFLYLALNQARLHPRARAYYLHKRREGKGHWPALRCLARHLCRIAFRMLSRGLTYAEATGAAPTWSPAPQAPTDPAGPGTGRPAATEMATPQPDVCDVPPIVKLVSEQASPTLAPSCSGTGTLTSPRSESTACTDRTSCLQFQENS
jgi:transposase